MSGGPARPAVPLHYLLWDGTDAVDSFALGTGLETQFRCIDLLNDSPTTEEFCSTAAKGKPRVYEPCGKDGSFFDMARYFRGMTEFPQTFFDPTHHNKGDDRPDILAYSGHGIPGFMFSERNILVGSTRPITASNISDRINLAATWAFVPTPQWNNANTKLVILSACRQLAGRPQQFLWSQKMRGASPVHAILTYRNTAPGAPSSAVINNGFIANCAKGQTLVEAWKNAHTAGDLPSRWAALCYRSSVTDKLSEWAKSGTLSAPANDETILYFDSQNLSGTPVVEPKPVLDCWLTAGKAVIPPWFPLQPGDKLLLHVKWTDPKQSFQDLDLVWIAAIQVRPDFGGPFDINQLFTIDGRSTKDGASIGAIGRCHDPKGWPPDSYFDLYNFPIKLSGMTFLNFVSSANEISIPITMGSFSNKRHPVYYFMVRVERNGTEFGIPTKPGPPRVADQAKLIDDFQFSVFLLDS
jgi:hypothetical protein